MAELPPGYRDIPPEDQEKARRFFERGRTVAETGNYDYAIEMYMQGLNMDPDARDAHQALRDISLVRKAAGGKNLGVLERMKVKTNNRDDKLNMLNAERLLAYDPGNTDLMVTIIQNAHRAGFYDTVMWMGPILLRANTDSKPPEIGKYLILKNIYKDLLQWKAAVEACQYALQMQPENMDLHEELKNLSALDTMDAGHYAAGGNFRQSMRDRERQENLLESERDVVSEDVLVRRLREAEAEWKADPMERGKLMKYVDALEATEELESENRAIELLEEAYGRTGQFPFRQRAGKIKMSQMHRMERSLRAAMSDAPGDEQLKQDYEAFKRELVEFELSEYTLAAQTYPSEMSYRYGMATRLFELGRFDESIPVFQQARSDPKLRIDGSLYLGRAFLESGFVDEAVETLQVVIDDYQLKGDDRSKEMYYWQGRAFEEKGTIDMAIKRYSQVAQWEFTYRDVQSRIRRLRSGGGAGAGSAAVR